ncbi:MAG TPA: DUF1501 domain-containing protein, partial [Verrucomicrobia bacterium]|nr:DUF1501 domain-containing protein [Verrucomicrobiota bacterium]
PFFENVLPKASLIKPMRSHPFKHGPAQRLIHIGHQNLWHPILGTWTMYGLGTENQNCTSRNISDRL